MQIIRKTNIIIRKTMQIIGKSMQIIRKTKSKKKMENGGVTLYMFYPHTPFPPPLELIRGDMLGMVLECHEGTIGYDRLLLKDCRVLVVHNFIETGNSHEDKCNRHFRKLLAHLRDIHSKDS